MTLQEELAFNPILNEAVALCLSIDQHSRTQKKPDTDQKIGGVRSGGDGRTTFELLGRPQGAYPPVRAVVTISLRASRLPLHRNSCDTFLISTYSHSREHLISNNVQAAIPSSTAAGFRQRDPQHYVGSELWQMQQEM